MQSLDDMENGDAYRRRIKNLTINNNWLERLTHELIEDRDYWENQSVELAKLVGDFFGESVGEFSSCNCPVQNAKMLLQKTQKNF